MMGRRTAKTALPVEISCPSRDPENGQHERIDSSDGAPNEGNDAKEIAAVGISQCAKGCFEPLLISSHDHDTEMGYGTSHQERKGDHKGQGNQKNDQENTEEWDHG